MAGEVLTGQEIGEAAARERTLEAIRIRAIVMFGGSPAVMAQIEQVGLAIEALSMDNTGSGLTRRAVEWVISAGQ